VLSYKYMYNVAYKFKNLIKRQKIRYFRHQLYTKIMCRRPNCDDSTI